MKIEIRPGLLPKTKRKLMQLLNCLETSYYQKIENVISLLHGFNIEFEQGDFFINIKERLEGMRYRKAATIYFKKQN